MQASEFMTVEQVAEKLHVSRATLFNWMQLGIFTHGKHFFKRGRVLRFIWSNDLVNALSGDSQEKTETATVDKPVKLKNPSPLNWDY